nr:hypothetical protein [Tanacetum cinerariifolium]
MLPAQAQESRVILHEEKQDFLADRLEDLDSDCDDLQLNTTSIFKDQSMEMMLVHPMIQTYSV